VKKLIVFMLFALEFLSMPLNSQSSCILNTFR